jgi:hypothetical protein
MARKKRTVDLDEKAAPRLEREPLPPLPKFSSGGPLSVEEMDEAICESILRRSMKR